MLLAYDHGMLPANLHFKEPNPNNKSLQDGTIKVSPVAAPVPFSVVQKPLAALMSLLILPF